MGKDSATGSPSRETPRRAALGSWRPSNAQQHHHALHQPISTIDQQLPAIYEQFLGYAQCSTLREMRTFEFTVERGKSSCSRRELASARPAPPSRSPSTWSARASSRRKRRFCGSSGCGYGAARRQIDQRQAQGHRQGPERLAGRRLGQGHLTADRAAELAARRSSSSGPTTPTTSTGVLVAEGILAQQYVFVAPCFVRRCCEDALGDEHAVDVVGVGLGPNEDDLLGLAELGGLVGVEDGLARGGARRGVQALGDDLDLGAWGRSAGGGAAPSGPARRAGRPLPW